MFRLWELQKIEGEILKRLREDPRLQKRTLLPTQYEIDTLFNEYQEEAARMATLYGVEGVALVVCIVCKDSELFVDVYWKMV